jgi:hypothetical protein
MRRIVLGVTVICGIGAAVALSNYQKNAPVTHFPREERNPVSHLRWNDSAEEFQFAIVSDRTGSHRANVFAQAVHKLNLLQPAFVMSVGDLIEGGKKSPEKLQQEWDEFDGFVNKLSMPFFYAAGNHDVAAKETATFWDGKLGRRYYHFIYRNVLFMMLNADDPPGSVGFLSPEQRAWAKQTLDANRDARWTIAIVHRPLWTFNDGANNGWKEIEDALAGRHYTVFCGHVHRFQKFVRYGQFYYQLATTGGGSALRGVEEGEFDHITWVTMKKDGPLLAHITLDAIHAENLQPFETNESDSFRTKLTLHPVRGQAFFEGTPMPGAVVTLTAISDAKKPVKAEGIVQGDGSFTLTTRKVNDGVPEGEYTVTVTWREKLRDGKPGASLLPERYGRTDQSELKTTIRAGQNNLILELKR